MMDCTNVRLSYPLQVVTISQMFLPAAIERILVRRVISHTPGPERNSKLFQHCRVTNDKTSLRINDLSEPYHTTHTSVLLTPTTLGLIKISHLCKICNSSICTEELILSFCIKRDTFYRSIRTL